MSNTTTSTNDPCTCSQASGTVGLVPNKRVEYNYGMVLGVDDFRQEQFHFEWKSKISNLLLHGYGTVCGLKVSVAPTSDGDVELRIEPGFAISPKGEWIWVEKAQCARLGTWVQGNKSSLMPPFLAGPQTVYVRLCYEECPTDLVPIAGSACAAQDQTRAPSRTTESFRAAFTWDAPPQVLEDEIRLLGELLHRVEVVDGPVSGPEDGGLIELVRELAGFFSSPPGSPPVGSPPIGSPPIGSPPNIGPILLDRLTACDTIRRALAVWITEVRPAIGGGNCIPPADSDDCLLLAALHFVADAKGVIQGSIEIDESRRPVLAPTRLIQELLPCGCHAEPAISSPPVVPLALPQQTFATLFLFSPNTLWARIHYPGQLSVPTSAVKILIDGVPAPMIPSIAPVSGVPLADNLFALTLPSGSTFTAATLATVEFDSTKITEIGSTPRQLSQVLSDPHNGLAYIDSHGAILSAFLPIGLFNAGSDLAGTYPNPTVVRLQSHPVSKSPPSPGDVLTFVPASGATPAEWSPLGAYVRTPISTPAYGIVAAGAFTSSQQGDTQRSLIPLLTLMGATNPPTSSPTYNLKAIISANQEIVLTFPSYDFQSVADNKLVYIVKGIVQAEKSGSSLPFATFNFVGARNDGLVIRLLGPNGQVIPAGFMVEISAYGNLPVGS